MNPVNRIAYYSEARPPTSADTVYHDLIGAWTDTSSGPPHDIYFRLPDDTDWTKSTGAPFDLAATIHAATTKTPPVDADEWGFWDSVSGLLRKCTWANLKSTLKTYFDSIYGPIGTAHAQNTDTGTTSNTFTIDSDSVLGKFIFDVLTGAADKSVTFTNVAITDDRIITFQDATGTVAFVADIGNNANLSAAAQAAISAAHTKQHAIDSAADHTGFGDSATKNVGTAAGTVAAGNHNHSGVYEPASANLKLMETVIPIDYCTNGIVADPGASVEYESGNFSAFTREFSGTANQDVRFQWPVDTLIDTSVKPQFLVEYVAADATAPAEGEIVAFSLAGYSVGNGDDVDGVFGAAVTSSKTYGAGAAADDRDTTDRSGDVTVTDLAAGETVMFQLIRLATTTDTYAGPLKVTNVRVFWKKL